MQIEVDAATYDKLAFAARIAGISVSEVVGRLIAAGCESRGAPGGSPAPSEPRTDTAIGVYVVYKDHRVDGTLDLATERLRITKGPVNLAGREFRSPTQAAMETVKVLNPERERPETNGWRFWKDASTGRIIDQIRGRPGGC